MFENRYDEVNQKVFKDANVKAQVQSEKVMHQIKQSYKEIYGLQSEDESDFRHDIGIFLSDDMQRAEQFPDILNRIT